MKKIFAFILIASSISFSSFAQTSKGGMKLEKQTLQDSLKISESVADSVIGVRQQAMTQMKSVMNDQSLSQDQRKAKMKDIKQETKMHLKNFLNDEQMQKMQEMEMERRQNKDSK